MTASCGNSPLMNAMAHGIHSLCAFLLRKWSWQTATKVCITSLNGGGPIRLFKDATFIWCPLLFIIYHEIQKMKREKIFSISFTVSNISKAMRGRTNG